MESKTGSHLGRLKTYINHIGPDLDTYFSTQKGKLSSFGGEARKAVDDLLETWQATAATKYPTLKRKLLPDVLIGLGSGLTASGLGLTALILSKVDPIITNVSLETFDRIKEPVTEAISVSGETLVIGAIGLLGLSTGITLREHLKANYKKYLGLVANGVQALMKYGSIKDNEPQLIKAFVAMTPNTPK